MLCAQLIPLLKWPIAMLQYRNKTATKALQRQQAERLRELTTTANVPLIINDDWQLALDIAADGVHLGAEDADPHWVRKQLGVEMIIGVSCYNNFERAQTMAKLDVDYLAFGAIFSSQTKPNAQHAELNLLQKARALHKPIVAIGGISPDNSAEVIATGADFIAVISGIFGAPNPEHALISYLNTFPRQDT